MQTPYKYYNVPLILSIIVYLFFSYQFWFVCDDAFISFRYAKNFSLGEGLRYNLGVNPPVEGYSNFLWVILAGIIHKLGFNIETVIPLFSIFSGVFCIVLVWQTVMRRLQIGLLPASLAVFSLALFPPFFVWATSGLATLPAATCLFASFVYLIYDKSWKLAGIFALLLSLLRAEGIVWSVAIGCLGVLANCKLKTIFKYFLSFLPLFLIYFIWRYTYYQELLPNTVVNKVGFSFEIFKRGFNYAVVYFLTFISPVAFLAGIYFYFKEKRKSAFAYTLLVLALLAYPVMSGGDFMAMGRFFVNTIPFQALAVAVVARRNLIIAAIFTIIGFLPAYNLHVIPKSLRSKFHFRLNTESFRSEKSQWAYMNYNSERWRNLGEALKNVTKPGDSIVAGAIGNLGYYSELFIYDRFGLVTKEVAQRNVRNLEAKSPGHDKAVSAKYFLKYKPTIFKAYIRFDDKSKGKDTLSAWGKSAPKGYDGEYFDLGKKDSRGREMGIAVLRRK